jgi:integrase
VCRIWRDNINLDAEDKYVNVTLGKTKAARRRVPLNDAAAPILKRRLEAAEGDYLFPHRKDNDEPMLKVKCPHYRSKEFEGRLLSPVRLPPHVRDTDG